MLSEIVEAAGVLRDALVGFDPAALTGTECGAVVDVLAHVEKACAGARVRAAARGASCGAHRQLGYTDPTTWLGRASGVGGSEARRALETGSAVDTVPGLAAALAAGELSLAQAHELVATEAVVPGAAADLLSVARRQPLSVLRDRARRRRLAAVDPDERHRRQHAARSLRHWQSDDGMVCGRFELPPVLGVALVNRLDRQTDRVQRVARREGRCLSREACAADALVELAMGGAQSGRGRAEVVLVCDVRALARGHSHAGEPCHIVGGGPVPVAVVRARLAESFVKAVLHDGTKIDTVVHYGRHLPAVLRTALELGAPPDFDGVSCADGCGRRYGLEWDHVDPVANNGATSFANLEPRCRPDHWAKTERDREAGLLRSRLDPAGARRRAGRADDEPP